MEIIRNAYKEIKFEELHEGDVFISSNDERLYMKTSEAYEYNDNRDYYLNAVDLEDGILIKFLNWEKVRIPKKIVLSVDE